MRSATVVDAVELAEREDVMFGRELADRIGRLRVGPRRLGDGLAGLGAVDGGRRGEHDPLDARVADRLRERHRAADIDVVIFARVEHRLRDRDACGQVENAVDLLQQRPELGTIAHVAAGEDDFGVQPGGVAGAQVVEHPHVVAVLPPAGWPARFR